MMTEPILEVRDVRKTFRTGGSGPFSPKREVHAVSGVSFALSAGETLGIVGESGSGKSTLGRLVTSLIPPTSGTVRFKGREMTTASPDELRRIRQHIQMIFQNPLASLSPRRMIIDSLTEPMEVFKIGTRIERVERAMELLEEVGLKRQYATRYPHEFSGGQCQRINIARALMLAPDLIVCDEPVSALDVSVQAQVINLLTRLQREHGLSYIIVSHDLNVIRYICDTIAVMQGGEIVEYGPAERVYEDPQHEYTKTLLAAIPGAARQANRSES